MVQPRPCQFLHSYGVLIRFCGEDPDLRDKTPQVRDPSKRLFWLVDAAVVAQAAMTFGKLSCPALPYTQMDRHVQ
jgi:hypothetical protein